MRVNARFDETTQQQLEYLTQVTGQSVSHVVRESVAAYYAQLRRQAAPSRLAAMAGAWKAGASGRTDTSTNAKAVVLEALKAKYPQHFGGPAQPVRAATTATAAVTATRRKAAAR